MRHFFFSHTLNRRSLEKNQMDTYKNGNDKCSAVSAESGKRKTNTADVHVCNGRLYIHI